MGLLGAADGPEGPELSDVCAYSWRAGMWGGAITIWLPHVTTCLLLSLPFGPAAPPELSLGTSLSRYLVAAIKPKTDKGVKREKAPQVGGHPPGSVSEPCSRPSTNSHGCTPTPRLGFLPFIVPAASGQAGLFYLLPAGTALLSLCLLASRLCKAMRGHRVEPQHCWPRPRCRKCRREELWPLALNTP